MFYFSPLPGRRTRLFISVLALSVAPVVTQAAPQSTADTSTLIVLDNISVVAVKDSTQKIAAPVSIKSRDELIAQGATTLGAALNGMPGVNADIFGGGASRPVIRGQTEPRIDILSGGLSVLDASDLSPDHAVTVDPLLADRIEVIRGPATLLYGGGAIGGVVNVVDNKVPTKLPEGGTDGQLILRGNTVAEGRAAAGQITTQVNDSNLLLHAQGSFRKADNYHVPNLEEPKMEGTFANSNAISLGLSWLLEDDGYIGLAYSDRSDTYGLPGHSHEFEGCHPVAGKLDAACGAGGHHHHGHHHPAPEINLDSSRWDLRGALNAPLPGIAQLRFRASYTDYQHNEVEIGEGVVTTFTDKGYQARIELQHQPLGNFTGTLGFEYADTTSSTVGEESILPKVDSQSAAVFVVEHYSVNDQWQLQAGLRQEWQQHSPVNGNSPDYSDSSTAVSGAAIWSFQPGWSLTMSVAHSERMPSAQALYANGVHIATNTYECGMLPSYYTCGGPANDRSSVSKEASLNYEIRLQKEVGRTTFAVSAYVNRIDNYIYARTLDQVEQFRLIKYSQRNAEFRGLEGDVSFAMTQHLDFTLFGDITHAEFRSNGDEVPRIPAARFGGRINYVMGRFDGELAIYRVNSQTHIAGFETDTPGYNMANVTLNYYLHDGRTRLFLHGANLFDQQAWNHASFLANKVPLPGRNLTVGVSYDF